MLQKEILAAHHAQIYTCLISLITMHVCGLIPLITEMKKTCRIFSANASLVCLPFLLASIVLSWVSDSPGKVSTHLKIRY